MVFTTTTEISRKGSKAFKDTDYATVLHNNNDIGMTIGGALYERLRDSGVVQDMLEDMEMEKNRDTLQERLKKSSESGLSNLVI